MTYEGRVAWVETDLDLIEVDVRERESRALAAVAEVRSEIGRLRQEIADDVSSLRAEWRSVKVAIYAAIGATLVALVGIIGTLVAVRGGG
jgi:hypothetical protein